MTTPLPSLPPRTRLRPRTAPPSVSFSAHRLCSLASSLATSWDTLDSGSRAELVQRIQRIASHLATDEPVHVVGPDSHADRLRFLTARELQVLSAIADGASTSEVAARLRLSTNTVRSYVKAILSKLGVHSRLEAVTLLMKADGATGRDSADDNLARSG
jgi:DNA-binding NarL/FixJ family response regulator